MVNLSKNISNKIKDKQGDITEDEVWHSVFFVLCFHFFNVLSFKICRHIYNVQY